VDEKFKGSLDEYVKANVATLKRLLKKVQIVKQEKFTTTAGLPGARVIVHNEQHGNLLRQTCYLFGNANTKYVVTCTTLAEGGEKLDRLFERSMKTFRFDKR
jgi:hypothetical protein